MVLLMEITFKTKRLAKIFSNETELIKKYGKEKSRKIMMRMAVLLNAPDLSCVPTQKPERCHELIDNRKGEFAVDLKHPFRLVFKPVHNPIPYKDDGGIDLVKVTSIEILSVEDYH